MSATTGEYERICALTGLEPDSLEQSQLDWSVLMAIRADYLSRREDYLQAASQVATRIASFSAIHSTRFRAKDPDHLIAKIIRKTNSYLKTPQKKRRGFIWPAIDPKNYRQGVTDLAGVRALHLYKQDWLAIDQYLCKSYKPDPKARFAYIRKGDEEALYKVAKCRVEVHEIGYRSVHYVVEIRPTAERFFIEIQVRTIFEEGWSEIDHLVRYPNFKNELVEKFLRDFNLLSGLADSMGNFVQKFRIAIEESSQHSESQRREVLDLREALGDMETELQKSQAYSGALKRQFEQFKAKFDSQTTDLGEASPQRFQSTKVYSVTPQLAAQLAGFSLEESATRMREALAGAAGGVNFSAFAQAMQMAAKDFPTLGKCQQCGGLVQNGLCSQCELAKQVKKGLSGGQAHSAGAGSLPQGNPSAPQPEE